MRKLMTAVFSQSVLIFYLTLSFIFVGDMNMANGQNTLPLEGEWEVTSSWTKSKKRDDRFIIMRKGDVYETSWKSQARDTKDYDFHGTPTQIMATYIASYDDLIDEFGNPQDDAFRSALRQLAGKVTKRKRITLSVDGRSAEYAFDTLYVNYGMRSGRLVNYEIQPFAGIITLIRVSGPVKAEPRSDLAYQADCGVVDPNRTTPFPPDHEFCPGNLVCMTNFCGGGMGCPYVCCPKGLPYLNHCDCKCYATSDFDCHSYSYGREKLIR